MKTEHKLTYDLSVFTPTAALWAKEGKDVALKPEYASVKV